MAKLSNLKDPNKERGSVAMEYVLVTLFSLVAGIALLGYSASMIQEKISGLGEEYGVGFDAVDLNPFED